jgi:uncharacterized protein YjiS (DUF1127 family)
MSSNISNPSSLSKYGDRLSIRPILEGFRAWRAARIAEAELYAFSDRDLRDIGLNRQTIRAAVRGGR